MLSRLSAARHAAPLAQAPALKDEKVLASVRAAGQATVLRLEGATVRALIQQSGALNMALWRGVGKQAAELALAQVGSLAKWQLERIVRRLEAHSVGGEPLEVRCFDGT